MPKRGNKLSEYVKIKRKKHKPWPFSMVSDYNLYKARRDSLWKTRGGITLIPERNGR